MVVSAMAVQENGRLETEIDGTSVVLESSEEMYDAEQIKKEIREILFQELKKQMKEIA